MPVEERTVASCRMAAMKTIPLDRIFVPWIDDQDPAAMELYARLGGSRYGLDWPKLLEKKRVVLLAEAGSGKSAEFEEQARLLTEAGKSAFYATVQDVGSEGLRGALSDAHRSRFDAWKESDQPAWLFIDSVDEAKLNGVRIEKALQRLADAVEGARARAHIVLSCRFTDWEFRADHARFDRYLPVPPPHDTPEAPSPDDLLVAVLHGDGRRKKKESEEPESSLVVLMAPLDEERVRKFAIAKGVRDVDAFTGALDAANLWSLARRPLDLDWLVTYWRTRGRFGTFAQMLATSLDERLQETNSAYGRQDPIQHDRALLALERIGAALVFGHSDKLLVPDTELTFAPEPEDFDLDKILPDWTPEHRTRLLSRPAFDPATFGRARLHNDNEGEVRSYLAARWLLRRKQNGAPIRDILSLLFAEQYDLSIIRPSARQTAAWLSIWDADVAREAVRREPSLLLNAGDPASLPASTRQEALAGVVVETIASGERVHLYDRDNLRRFSGPELVPQIRSHWDRHKGVAEVRILLLEMIGLGKLVDCADLAIEGVLGPWTDDNTLVFGGRALLAVASPIQRTRYGQLVQQRAADLPGTMVWDALDGLFPETIDVPILLALLKKLPIAVRDETLGLSHFGPRLAVRIGELAALKELLSGLLTLLGPSGDEHRHLETVEEKAYLPFIAAAANRLLQLVGGDDAPTVALDAALRIGETRTRREQDSDASQLVAALHATPTRRRAAFWRAVGRFKKDALGNPIQNSWQLDFLGWSTGLRPEDIEWLLRDMRERAAADERMLVLSCAMDLWRTNGQPDVILARIRGAAATDAELTKAVERWLAPPTMSPEYVEIEQRQAAMREKYDQEQAERDKSWIDYIAKLKADPKQMRTITAPTSDSVDRRLFNLWQLLESLDERGARYAIDSVVPLEPLLGAELAYEFRDALIKFWRHWEPTLKSSRAPDKRNQSNLIDCMGITSITLEAAANRNWVKALTAAEATRAAEFATLELNGYPAWFFVLAEAWPDEVREVLTREIAVEVRNPPPGPRYGNLEKIARDDRALAGTIADPLFDELARDAAFPSESLAPALEAITRGISPARRNAFIGFALERFAASAEPDVASLYFGAAFRLDAETALAAMSAKLDTLPNNGQTALVQHAFSRTFGDRVFNHGVPLDSIPFHLLERLMLIAFRTIRIEEDNHRPSGQVYSPDARDAAERARNALFNYLVNVPGRATFSLLGRLAKLKDFPISAARLAEIALDRARSDAEQAPWLPGGAYALEQDFDMAPRTPADLQAVALRRLDDIQHDLQNDDFSQGRTLKSLPNETEVQKWVADALHKGRRRAYSVERESHVADEKAPDVRLRAKSSDASLPIEIKVAEDWTLKELEDALAKQLGARYLRAQDAAHGVLLLVHLSARSRGWKTKGNRYLSFGEVVAHLKRRAAAQAARAPDAPQALVATLDVSSLQTSKRKASVSRKSKKKGSSRRIRRHR